jgi:hypothetical protein
MDGLMPLVFAPVFVLLMSLIPEPARQRFNAVFVGGAGGAYISGGFGLLEVPFALLAAYVAYLGLRSYSWIGVAWLLHTARDVALHLYGNPIWHFAPTSSAGCAIFDAAIAIWFFAGAPSVTEWMRGANPAQIASRSEP